MIISRLRTDICSMNTVVNLFESDGMLLCLLCMHMFESNESIFFGHQARYCGHSLLLHTLCLVVLFILKSHFVINMWRISEFLLLCSVSFNLFLILLSLLRPIPIAATATSTSAFASFTLTVDLSTTWY